MGEKPERMGKLIYLDAERKIREYEKRIESLEQASDQRKEKRPELIEDLNNWRKKIIKILTDRKGLDDEKARELLEEINKTERGIKNKKEE